MPRRPRSVWALYGDVTEDGTVRDFSRSPQTVERLPRGVELSPDGQWATVHRRIRGRLVPVATYVNLGPEKVGGGRLSSRRDKLPAIRDEETPSARA